MKKTFFLLLLLSGYLLSSAQIKNKTIRAGLFSSFYLDSAFDGAGNYILKDNFPRQAIAGLEFYEGAVMAVDSINATGISATMEVYDIKSRQENIEKLLKQGKFDSLDIMFFYGGLPEYIELAKISKQKKIPLVSASYPNDGGIKESPLVYIANPKINAHLQMVADQLKMRWGKANVIWFKRLDQGDNRLEQIFKETIENIKINTKPKFITLASSFTTQDILRALDTTKHNVLIAGSLDNNFALNFARAISFIEKKGIIQIIGLPNWDGLKEIQSPIYAGIPIYFSSGMAPVKENKWATKFDDRIKDATGVPSSTPAIKGFELTFYFLNVLAKHGSLTMNDPSDKAFKVFNDFDFKPIYSTEGAAVADYIENKKVYFIRRLNGVESNQ
ncbi:MAG: hypothetical protein ACK5AO_02490 [bacterium]|jgi:ABC-type branched-subunit amino acid transport system substrate-binding protein